MSPRGFRYPPSYFVFSIDGGILTPMLSVCFDSRIQGYVNVHQHFPETYDPG